MNSAEWSCWRFSNVLLEWVFTLPISSASHSITGQYWYMPYYIAYLQTLWSYIQHGELFSPNNLPDFAYLLSLQEGLAYQCRYLKCAGRVHPTKDALKAHVDLSHLSRLSISCPVRGMSHSKDGNLLHFQLYLFQIVSEFFREHLNSSSTLRLIIKISSIGMWLEPLTGWLLLRHLRNELWHIPHHCRHSANYPNGSLLSLSSHCHLANLLVHSRRWNQLLENGDGWTHQTKKTPTRTISFHLGI